MNDLPLYYSFVSFYLFSESITFADNQTLIYATIGDRKLLPCEAKSSPPPLLTWNFNGSQVQGKQFYCKLSLLSIFPFHPPLIFIQIFVSVIVISGAAYIITEDGLVVNNVTEGLDGNYTCKAIVTTTLTSMYKEHIITLKIGSNNVTLLYNHACVAFIVPDFCILLTIPLLSRSTRDYQLLRERHSFRNCR